MTTSAEGPPVGGAGRLTSSQPAEWPAPLSPFFGRCCGQCPAAREENCDCAGDPCPICRACANRCCACDAFVCGQCGAHRMNPPAASDDYECDEGHWRPCGAPLCESCARQASSCPEYAHLISDGGPAC